MRDNKIYPQAGKDLQYLIQRIDSISGILSQSDLLDLADHLHEIVRSRRDKRSATTEQMSVEFI